MFIKLSSGGFVDTDKLTSVTVDDCHRLPPGRYDVNACAPRLHYRLLGGVERSEAETLCDRILATLQKGCPLFDLTRKPGEETE